MLHIDRSFSIYYIFNAIRQKEPFPDFFLVGELGIDESNKIVYRKPPTKTNILDIYYNIVSIISANFISGFKAWKTVGIYRI